jgi:formylmethanofuran dehydrogenase subunit B
MGPSETLTTKKAKVHINTAISGVESGGSAIRMDGTLVSFKPIVETKNPLEEYILKRIMEAL